VQYLWPNHLECSHSNK